MSIFLGILACIAWLLEAAVLVAAWLQYRNNLTTNDTPFS